jgi:hypothetical protein
MQPTRILPEHLASAPKPIAEAANEYNLLRDKWAAASRNRSSLEAQRNEAARADRYALATASR